jgi:sugar phosphate isomerase/epimerase
LIEHGAEGVELAPTKVWSRPLEATAAEVRAYRDSWERRGLRIVALQALLFGQPELTLFEDTATRRMTVEYLKGMIGLGAALGAGPWSSARPGTGGWAPCPAATPRRSPSRRSASWGISPTAAASPSASSPTPRPTAATSSPSAAEGADLVERVACAGFGLHLDTAAMTLAADPVEATFARSAASWSHFHVSEPDLAPVGRGAADHRGLAGAVRRAGYAGWTSIEMKEAGPEGTPSGPSPRPWASSGTSMAQGGPTPDDRPRPIG